MSLFENLLKSLSWTVFDLSKLFDFRKAKNKFTFHLNYTYVCKQIFFRRNTNSVTLLEARFKTTSIVIVTSTSAERIPVHNISIENVSISVGMLPLREIFMVGLGNTAGSDVNIFTLYGNYKINKKKEKG